jgi:hypothetical protein
MFSLLSIDRSIMATADVILSRASLHASLLAPAALNLVALVTLGGSEPTLPSLVTIAGLRLPRYVTRPRTPRP